MTSDLPKDHEGRRIDFGETAEDYDQFRPGFPPSFFDALNKKGWIQPGQQALDLGTGTGSVALGLARQGLKVTGLDLSPQLLGVAQRKSAQQSLQVEFLEARAEETGLASSTFDVVTAGQCWWWFDAERVLNEVWRVLKPGGRLVIENFSYLPIDTFDSGASENLAQQTEALILGLNPNWTMSGGSGVYESQVRDLDRARFLEIETFSYVEHIAFSHKAWRGRMRACNAVGASLPKEEVTIFDQRLQKLLEEHYPDPVSVPHRIFVASGTT